MGGRKEGRKEGIWLVWEKEGWVGSRDGGMGGEDDDDEEKEEERKKERKDHVPG